MPEVQTQPVERTAPVEKKIPSDATEIMWFDGFNEQTQLFINKSRKEDKPILIYFYNKWCPYCNKMVKETFHDPAVVKMINKSYIPIRIDVENAPPKMLKTLEVSRVPHIILYKPAPDLKDSKVTRIHGFQTPEEVLDFLIVSKLKL